jgi:hypothetical protein
MIKYKIICIKSAYDLNNKEVSLYRPKCIKCWRGHDSAITSIQYVSDLEADFIVTCSVDWCCRVWRMDGAYVGVFGQNSKWNLNIESTYQSMANLTLQIESIEAEVSEKDEIENVSNERVVIEPLEKTENAPVSFTENYFNRVSRQKDRPERVNKSSAFFVFFRFSKR